MGRLKYYRDIGLLLKIFLLSFRLPLIRSNRMLSVANTKIRGNKNNDIKKITRYVNLCLYIRKRLGFKDTCLTRSILLCHILRESGVDASINFGIKKEGNKIRGHSWVANFGAQSDFDDLFSYPNVGEGFSLDGS